MKLEPPNPIKTIKFVVYYILSDYYNSVARDFFLNKREEKNGMNQSVSSYYRIKSWDYGAMIKENRTEGLAQRILDKLLF